MRTCIDSGVFARWWAVRAQTGRKEPWQLFSPQLILQWGSDVYFKETIIFTRVQAGGGGGGGGGQKCQEVQPFPR